jgi:hypothetical protein
MAVRCRESVQGLPDCRLFAMCYFSLAGFVSPSRARGSYGNCHIAL